MAKLKSLLRHQGILKLVALVWLSFRIGLASASVSGSKRRHGSIIHRRGSNTRHTSAETVLPTSSTAGFAATAVAPAATADMVVQKQDDSIDESSPNLVVAAVGFFKDAIVRTIDGIGTSWSNYGQCNAIRAKQKQYKQALRLEWENQGQTRADINARLKRYHKFSGITYEEYMFLKRGLADRNKLTQLALWSWAAPRFLPYMIMMNPDMLPSAFETQAKVGAESKLHLLSRTRSHAVVQTLMRLEKDAYVAPALAQFNIFGRKAQKRAMEQANILGQSLSKFWTRQQQQGVAIQPQDVVDALSKQIYSRQELTQKQQNLVGTLPKSVYRGFQQVLEQGSPFSNYLPVFFARKKLLEHLQKLQEADEFLIDQQIDIDSLSPLRLVEACQDRMVVSTDSTEELKQALQTWLDITVVQPRTRDGYYFNGNMARTALLGLNLAHSTQSQDSASYLARNLYQSMPLAAVQDDDDDDGVAGARGQDKKRRRNRKMNKKQKK